MDQETESQNGKIAPMFVYLVNDRAETNLSVLTSSPVLFFTAPRYLLHFSLLDCDSALTLILSLGFFCSVSRSYRLFVTLWIAARQAPLSVGFHRQEYWVPISSPGDLPNPGIEPASPASPALAGRFFPLHHLGSPWILFTYPEKS